MKPAFAITFTTVVFILDSTQTQACGISIADLGKRVVNGKDAKAHSWPWMVSLRYNGRHICGGSLIKVNWVVTAAHCVERDRQIGSYTVVVGSHHRTSTTQFERSYNLKKIIIHEKYLRSHLRNDIAVLQLEASIDTSLQVNVVCLPKAENRVEPRKRCYITGWGRTVGGGNAAITLQEAPLPVADTTNCSRINGRLVPVDDKTMLCAGGEGIAGGCQGDSGGSFVCKEHGRYFLRGVVSWGHGNCRTDHFTVFARVSSFINWINEKTSVSARGGGGGKGASCVGGCVDKDWRCKYWTRFCGSNSYVLKNCKKTCKRCIC